jgi:hypothetical protein
MRIVTTISPRLTDPEAIAVVARYFLSGVIEANRLLIRAGLIPSLYTSGVRYRPEPWGKGIEEFADAVTVLKRGWGDCDDLAPWRTAELREAGDAAAGLKISWKTRIGKDGKPFRGFHVVTRHGDGRVEDPSRYLGM